MVNFRSLSPFNIKVVSFSLLSNYGLFHWQNPRKFLLGLQQTCLYQGHPQKNLMGEMGRDMDR